MKARVKPGLNAAQQKALDEEIRRQCVEQTRKYEKDIDTVILYVLHRDFGFGIGRLRKFYSAMFKHREEMQEFFQSDQYDVGMAEHAMRYQLREDGIDVEEIFKEHESRFKVSLK